MRKPRISRQARADLRTTAKEIARRHKPASDRLVDEFWATAKMHAEFPQTGRPRDDLMPGFRTFVVSDFVVVFRAVDDTIEVIRFLHGSRDIGRIIREETEL